MRHQCCQRDYLFLTDGFKSVGQRLHEAHERILFFVREVQMTDSDLSVTSGTGQQPVLSQVDSTEPRTPIFEIVLDSH